MDFQVLGFFVTFCQHNFRSSRQTGCRIRSLYIQVTFSMCVCVCVCVVPDLTKVWFLYYLSLQFGRMTKQKLERFEQVFNMTSARILTIKGVK